jgi:gamma-glutamyltranspeptidase / glutathione hydrolase
LLIASGLVVSCATAGAKPAKAATRIPEVTSKKGMVASAHPIASEAGLAILKKGGNAVDAAVAAAFAIGVAEPNATGLGGEGMMVIYLAKDKKAVAIDYRSTAPGKAMPGHKWESSGPMAVAVPGTVAGLAMALEKYGTMSLAEVVEPAAKAAEQGFIISETLASTIFDGFDGILANPALAAILTKDGLPLEAGDLLKNPDLAASLRKIGAGGARVFYEGAIADAIAAEMAASGGIITKADLAAYKAIEREPSKGSYRGYGVISAPSPVGGLTCIEILQILENYDLRSFGRLSPRSIHVMAEAMKRGFADFNAYVGDPGFADVPAAVLASKEYAKARAAEISLNAVTPKVQAAKIPYESPSTTHLSVADSKGNMVALTQTISSFWGAKVLVPGTGIILNNEMVNWSAKGPNEYAPGKRMRTTISPTILTTPDGTALASLGTPGAARIISTMTILVTNIVDHGMGIQEAIEAPRFYARDSEKELQLEPRVPAETIAALKALGYVTNAEHAEYDLFFGGAQGILRDPKTGRFNGGADPRRDGAVLGY